MNKDDAAKIVAETDLIWLLRRSPDTLGTAQRQIRERLIEVFD